MLVLGCGLNTREGRIREEAARDAEEDLGADHPRLLVPGCPTAIVDQETECDKKQDRAGDDEGFEAANTKYNCPEAEADQNRAEAVERKYACRAEDAEVERNDEDSVEVIALTCPGEVEHDADAQGAPDGAVAE